MDAHPDQAYIFCTPFLNEIDRIIEDCRLHSFVQPQNFNQSKIEDFNDLLAEQKDIAVTHSTFLNATQETMDLISQGNYVLFLDEALDVVCDFNKTTIVEYDTAQRIKKGDIKFLKDSNTIRITDSCRIEWIGADSTDSKYSELERLARQGRVYLARDSVMVCVFPPEIFGMFSQVYIMTYMLEGNTIKPYFDLFGFAYQMASVEREENGLYQICAYNPAIDAAWRREVRELITVCDNDAINYDRSVTLTKQWYAKNAKVPDAFKGLRGHVGYYFKKIVKAKAHEIMWTCPSEYQDKIKGAGYTSCGVITREQRETMTPAQLEKEKKRLSCFVPCNAKATNEYQDRGALAYCCNMYYNTAIKGLFTDNGILFDDDQFALSCMIQWVWRSRIRVGEPIHIYVPAKRMRDLFLAWLWQD